MATARSRVLFSSPSFRLQRRAMRAGDWIKLSLVLVAAAMSVVFLFGQLGLYYMEMETLGYESNGLAYQMWFEQRVANQHNTPHEVYEEARQALLNNDLEGVLATLHPADRNAYEPGLREAAQQNRLPEAAARMMPLTEKTYDDGYTVIYRTEPIPGNVYSTPLEGWSEEVGFTLDSNGLWKISSI